MSTNEKRISDWRAGRQVQPAEDTVRAKSPGTGERPGPRVVELESVRREMEQDRVARRRSLVTRLFLFVGIPLVAVFAYAGLVAQPLYAGEAVFTVQTSTTSAPAPNAGFFAGASSSNTINDAFKTRAFILSRPMMRHMEEEYGFMSHFATGMDPLTRLGGLFGAAGDPLDYYRKRVIVTVDVQEGILRLYVQARTREDAERFGQGILAAAQQHVNESSALIGNDQIAALTADVQQAEDSLSQARGEFTGVKAQQGDLNPERTAEVVYNLISNLELELAESVRQRQELMRDGLVDSPLLPPIDSKIGELRSQIAANRARLSNPGGRSLAQTVGAFDSANSRQEMAQVRWQGALSTLRDAYLDVLRQRRYFVLVVGMSAGEEARVRDWTAIVLPILLLLGILARHRLHDPADGRIPQGPRAGRRIARVMQPVAHDCRAELAGCVQMRRWDDAIALYRSELDDAVQAEPISRLCFAIALIRSGKIGSGLARLLEIESLSAEGRDLLRRHVIAFLVQEKRFDDAVAVIDRLDAGHAATADDIRLRGSLNGRMRRHEPAIRDVRRLLELDPGDRSARLSLLKLLLQASRNHDAADFARSLGKDAASHPELAGLALMAIERGGEPADALVWAEALETAGDDADSAAPAVQAWLVAGRLERAATAAEGFLERGLDSRELRRHLATALLAGQDQDRERLERAADLLEELAADPAADAGLLVLRARALMRLGRESEAAPLLARALALQPQAAGLRALHAKALRHAGLYVEAAREYRRLLPAHPESHNFHRYAAGALSLSGKPDEARRVFDSFIAARTATLPDEFEAGLDALWGKIDDVMLPPERLDWAWSLRADQSVDRAEWERRARWGHLADHYILDWLECRDDKVHEAMARLADLEPAERAFEGIDRARGMVLASAHIGPMYAGPLALELLGIEARWLASTPSCVATSYGRSLISTSDQTGAEVARQTLRTLGEGKAAVIAIDGAIALSAPRVPFAGQHITLSGFAPRMAQRLSIPSLFVAPRWEEGRIGFTIEPMPDARPDESADEFALRWQEAFLGSLRRYLSGEPENLRLSGGIWRHLVPLRD